jgi:hypothetical protein
LLKASTTAPAFTPASTTTTTGVGTAQPEGRDFRIWIAILAILVFLLAGFFLFRSSLRNAKR